jgi:hypothetical protein
MKNLWFLMFTAGPIAYIFWVSFQELRKARKDREANDPFAQLSQRQAQANPGVSLTDPRTGRPGAR